LVSHAPPKRPSRQPAPTTTEATSHHRRKNKARRPMTVIATMTRRKTIAQNPATAPA
jgi:hypothetical protein